MIVTIAYLVEQSEDDFFVPTVSEFDVSLGSSRNPLLVALVPSKFGFNASRVGFKFVFLIRDRFYELVKYRAGKQFMRLRCKTWRQKQKFGRKCSYTVRVRNIFGDEAMSAEDARFGNKENWRVIPNESPYVHLCDGFPGIPGSH